MQLKKTGFQTDVLTPQIPPQASRPVSGTSHQDLEVFPYQRCDTLFLPVARFEIPELPCEERNALLSRCRSTRFDGP